MGPTPVLFNVHCVFFAKKQHGFKGYYLFIYTVFINLGICGNIPPVFSMISFLAQKNSNYRGNINPLNAELNPICHLLVLLGDLTFMGPCIVIIFQYISNKMQRYTVYLYLETALHISGGTSTHHQQRIQLHLQHLVFVTTLLLSATIVEELEPV